METHKTAEPVKLETFQRWQQTYQVNFHCFRSSEHAHNAENNGFTQ